MWTNSREITSKCGRGGTYPQLTCVTKGLWEKSEILVARNGRTEVDEGDADVDEAEVVVVLEALLHTTSGTTGKPMLLMNTGERDVAAAMKGNIMAVGHLFVVPDSTEGGEDAEDVDKTRIMVTDGPLLIMALTHSLHRTLLIRLRLSL